MTLRIAVVGNMQVRGLAHCLRALLPSHAIVQFEAGPSLTRPRALRAAEADLARCDYILAHRLPAQWGRLAADNLAASTSRTYFLPAISFSGFHPDTITLASAQGAVPSPTGELHSRLAILGYLAGYSVRQTFALYNRLVFGKLGYFRNYSEQTARLGGVFMAHSLELAPLQARWLERGCFMHAPDRPKIGVMLDLARIGCRLAAIEPEIGDVAPEILADPFADGESHPVYSDIAALSGVAPGGAFRAGSAQAGLGKTFKLHEFLAKSFEIYRNVDPATLLAAEGVPAGLDRLHLPIRPPARPVRKLQAGMALMTCHGTLLRVAAGNLMVRHLPLNVSIHERAPLRVDFADPARGHGFESEILGGVQIVAGAGEGLVALRRGDRLLCAERDGDTAGFSRDEVGPWESFWPIAMADLTLLAWLSAQDWRIMATGEIVPGASVRLAPGYQAWFGRWRLDLRNEMPVLQSAMGQERPLLRLWLDGEMMIAVCDSRAPEMPAQAQAAGPQPLLLGQRRVVTGAAILLSLPMVGCDADRRWLYDAYAWPRPVPAGRVVHGAALHRAGGVRIEFDPSGAVRRAAEDRAVVPMEGAMILAAPQGLPIGANWVEAAIRLFMLAPYLPANACLLLPSQGVSAEVVAAWQAIGVARPMTLAASEGCLLDDLSWVVQDSASLFPAEVLVALRDRARATPVERERIFVHGLGAPTAMATISAMEERGFEPVDLSAMAPLQQMQLFAGARWVVGATGLDLAGLAFCAAGTRVIELSAPRQFVPSAWMGAAKIGLNFAILPGLDLERFDKLVIMLGNRDI